MHMSPVTYFRSVGHHVNWSLMSNKSLWSDQLYIMYCVGHSLTWMLQLQGKWPTHVSLYKYGLTTEISLSIWELYWGFNILEGSKNLGPTFLGVQTFFGGGDFPGVKNFEDVKVLEGQKLWGFKLLGRPYCWLSKVLGINIFWGVKVFEVHHFFRVNILFVFLWGKFVLGVKLLEVKNFGV